MITGNTATDGAGVGCSTSSAPTLTACRIIGNTGTSSGGGLRCAFGSNPVLVNCIISANLAETGAGVYCSAVGNPTVTNCTIAGNSATSGGGVYCSASSPTLSNCIVWGNTAPEIYLNPEYPGIPTVTYCDVQGGWPGAGNIDVSPGFVSPQDFHLTAGSSCIDAGNNAAVPGGILTDLEGRLRFVDDPFVPDTGSGTPPVVDMGAYERQLKGDFDKDLDVDNADFGPLTACLEGPDVACATECRPGDFNDDGDVDLTDLAAFQSAFTGVACGEWTQVPCSGPSARRGLALAYDEARGVTVLFGGEDETALSGETWEFDGSVWSLVATTGPAPRRQHVLVYDAVRHVVVLFGGYGAGGESAPYGDTWTWNGSQWTDMTPVLSPSARYYTGAAFDAQHSVIVLFSGVHAGGSADDTWEWDGTTWVQRVPVHSPGLRIYHAMAYDGTRSAIVLFGGYGVSGVPGARGDTWEWNGDDWALLSTSGPAPRILPAMAGAGSRGVVVLFGGILSDFTSCSNETWKWNGVDWEQCTPLVSPPGRYYHGLAYDTVHDTPVLFGGRACTPVIYGDTWTWISGQQ
jgi:hypothetical protein